MSLMIIGKTATKVMETYAEFTQVFSQTPWRNMRNRMAHGYFDIDLNIVWDTLQEWLPVLLAQLIDDRKAAEDGTSNFDGRSP